MRVAQFRILNQILEQFAIPEYIYAFEKGRSIPVMAERHVGKALVISLDIKDYFPSIKQRMLEQIFDGVGMAKEPSRTLSELCTVGAQVPQGALTSPKISNIVTSLTFGPDVKAYCDQKGLELTIYADDITMSSSTVLSNEVITEIIETVTRFVSEYGFRINRRKTKIMRKAQRQWVCGAVVNQKVNLLKRERQRLRAIVHNCEKNGISAEASKNNLSESEFISQIMGKLNWFAQLNQEQGTPMKNTFHELAKGLIASVAKETETGDQALASVVEDPDSPSVTPAQGSESVPWTH